MASPIKEQAFRLASLLILILQAVSIAQCQQCHFELVESMPEGLELIRPAGTPIKATHEALLEMIVNAKKTLRISSFYLTLTPEDAKLEHPSTVPGRKIFDGILEAARRGVDVEVIVNLPNKAMCNQHELEAIKEAGGRVKTLDMRRLLGAGILHSKFMITDNQTLYVGSSNFDWRSYTQIKEIGVSFVDCPSLAQDLDKIQRTYSLMSELKTLPDGLSADFKALTSLSEPAMVDDVRVSLAGAPPAFNSGTGRTDDIDALLHTIERARKFVDISVMNYSPRMDYARIKEYWPLIDDALRRAAAERGVRVRLLFSKWSSSKPLETVWYKSLNALHTPHLRGGGIHVKMFEVPAFDEFQKALPYARVKHDKYMVTDKGLYIGTSNWAPDYFKSTCGVGVVMESVSRSNETPQVVKTMQDLFERDFNSEYAHELE